MVSQTDDVHEEIADLLRFLRRVPRAGPEGPNAPRGARKQIVPEIIAVGDDGPAEERIRKALASPSQLDFVETPLTEVIDYLKKLHRIEIQLDTKALEELGVAADTPVTKNLKGISLKSVLKLILEPLQLTYIIKNEVLMITSQDNVSKDLTTKAYPVAGLLFPAGATVELTGLVSAPPGSSATAKRTGKGPQFDFDPLVTLITSTVQPTTWDSAGGAGSIAPFSDRGYLVISQTQDVHDDVAKLLEMLRKEPKAKRYGVEAPALALECKAQTDVDEMPPDKLLDYLKDRYQIKVHLDRKGLRTAGARPDTPVGGRVAGMPWRLALRRILGRVDLGFIVKDDVLLVTSRERAARELVTVVYSVSDLATARKGGEPPDIQPLLDAVTTTVRPDSWTSRGGRGTAAVLGNGCRIIPVRDRTNEFQTTVDVANGCRLIVRQTQEVQEQIAELLKKLREASGTPQPPTRGTGGRGAAGGFI